VPGVVSLGTGVFLGVFFGIIYIVPLFANDEILKNSFFSNCVRRILVVFAVFVTPVAKLIDEFWPNTIPYTSDISTFGTVFAIFYGLLNAIKTETVDRPKTAAQEAKLEDFERRLAKSEAENRQLRQMVEALRDNQSASHGKSKNKSKNKKNKKHKRK
jgi:hypothetical protein